MSLADADADAVTAALLVLRPQKSFTFVTVAEAAAGALLLHVAYNYRCCDIWVINITVGIQPQAYSVMPHTYIAVSIPT